MNRHLIHEELTHEILSAAVEVHRRLGPGLLESTYRSCLVRQLNTIGVDVAQEVPIPIVYDGYELDAAYRADLIADGRVLVELKAAERLLPIHVAQTLTYLKLSGLRVAMLLNFNVTRMSLGVRRFVR
jgi:GxxExxY protein